MIDANLVKDLINNGPSDDLKDQIKTGLNGLAVDMVKGVKTELVDKLGQPND